MTVDLNSKTSIIDFSGKIDSCDQYSNFNNEELSDIREQAQNGIQNFIVIDTGYSDNINEPYVVSDHINLSGDNPLVGPNDPIGDRFPVINDVYLKLDSVADLFKEMKFEVNIKSGKVAAGVKPGVVPTDEDIALINNLGADFYCYNLIPAALVAAHAKRKVLGIVIPSKMKPVESLSQLFNGGN